LLERADAPSREPERQVKSGLVRALALSIAAASIPITGAFLFPTSLQDYEALTWLTLLVPAFLWAYERGWRGVATALALGMAAVSITYALMQLRGGQIPDLLLAVIVVYVGVSLGIGLFGDRLGKARYEAAAETLALQDPLTGLPNRRHAELHLEIEFAAAERGRALAVIVFDIDHFDAYNSRSGRAAGDGVLKGIASLLRQHTRRMDLSARYGPEEFVTVLGGCPEEGAVVFAGRLQERLRAAEHTVTLPTISAGIACYRPEMDGPAELLRAAEEALQLAKRDGRDRVRVFGRALDELQAPDSMAVQRAAAEAAVSHADAMIDAVRFDPSAEVAVGRGRSALLVAADGPLSAQLAEFLRAEEFQVMQVGHGMERLAALQQEFDVALVELALDSGAGELVRQLRSRRPQTRIVGVYDTGKGSVSARVLDVRVDCHVSAGAPADSLRQTIAELLRERDVLIAAQLKQRQLSNELRARDREARVALEASEAKYRSVVQSVQEVIFTTDGKWAWTFLNPAWSAITGFSVEETLGRSLFEYLHPEEADAVREHFEELTATRTPYSRREGRVRTRGGAHRWIELRLQLLFTPGGELDGSSGVLADVTERRRAEDALRRSEEYFRSLIEKSTEMTAVLNGDGTIRYVSPAVERVLGFAAAELVHTNAQEWFHPADREVAADTISAVMDEAGADRTITTRVRHADGGWRDVEASVRNLLHTPGVEGLVVNARDITARQEAERALRDSEELLLRAQKMDAIGRLAGGVAHDFNNLLTAIQGHADLLISELDEEAAILSDLVEIRDAAARATALTRQLLAFSRRQVMQPRLLDVNATVREMEKMLRRIIGHGVTLVTELDSDAGFVSADPVQVEQVLLNLMVNARDAMPRGGRITVQTSHCRVEADDTLAAELVPGAYVQLSVIDSGTGMTDDVAAHAFEPFFTTKDQGQGTGLGLATVYGIVKQSGGHAWLETETEHGTRVNLLLPRVDAPAELPQIEPTMVTPSRGGDERILLVEDEKAVRELALRILEKQGYAVIAAENGREALDLVRTTTERIDLLLTDVVMPEMNGQDLAESLRALRPDIRVIFISGYNEEAVLRHGVLAEDTAFLEKPFSPSGLLALVRRMLDTAPAQLPEV
jgi:two-component system, cell cycle sensor histidine kinase and response regulator CckA